MILFIASKEKTYTLSRFQEELKKLNKKYQIINPESIMLQSDFVSHYSGENRVLIRSSGLNYDDTDLLMAKLLEDSGSLILNPITEQQIFRDKLTQYFYFLKEKISTPETIYFKGKIDRSKIKKLIAHFPSDEF